MGHPLQGFRNLSNNNSHQRTAAEIEGSYTSLLWPFAYSWLLKCFVWQVPALQLNYTVVLIASPYHKPWKWNVRVSKRLPAESSTAWGFELLPSGKGCVIRMSLLLLSTMPSEADRLAMCLRCLKLPHLQLSVLCKGVPPILADLLAEAGANACIELAGVKVCVAAFPCSQY